MKHTTIGIAAIVVLVICAALLFQFQKNESINQEPKIVEGSSQDKMNNLIDLYNEETLVFSHYKAMLNSGELTKEEVAQIYFLPVDKEVSTASTESLFSNLVKLESYFGKRGLGSANQHVEKLNELKRYFLIYKLSETDVVSESATQATQGFKTANNQKEFMSVIQQRFNIWKQNNIDN